MERSDGTCGLNSGDRGLIQCRNQLDRSVDCDVLSSFRLSAFVGTADDLIGL